MSAQGNVRLEMNFFDTIDGVGNTLGKRCFRRGISNLMEDG